MPPLSQISYWKRNSAGEKRTALSDCPALKAAMSRGERADIQVDKEKGQCVRVNGGNQPGYLVAYRAMELAIARAKQTGASIVGVYKYVALWYGRILC